MVFGRIFDDGVQKKMPFSVEVHHALMDGIHVGKYSSFFRRSSTRFEPFELR